MKRFLFLIVAMLVVASGGSVEAASKRVKKKRKEKWKLWNREFWANTCALCSGFLGTISER